LIPISVFVTMPALRPVRRCTLCTTFFAPCGLPEWSGHLIPTGPNVMQSGQIPRPHSEQETPVSRSGCR
jgi:hypothetical protein